MGEASVMGGGGCGKMGGGSRSEGGQEKKPNPHDCLFVQDCVCRTALLDRGQLSHGQEMS